MRLPEPDADVGGADEDDWPESGGGGAAAVCRQTTYSSYAVVVAQPDGLRVYVVYDAGSDLVLDDPVALRVLPLA